MEPEIHSDPFEWDVSQVINFFNHLNPSIAGPGITLDKSALSESLLDNDINGLVLLTWIDDERLRSSLGITSLGQRTVIRYAISKLRKQSKKYPEHVQWLEETLSLDLPASVIGTPTLASPSAIRHSHPSTPSQPNILRKRSLAIQHQSDTPPQPISAPLTTSDNLSGAHIASTPLDPSYTSPNRANVTDDERVPKRRKVAPELVESAPAIVGRGSAAEDPMDYTLQPFNDDNVVEEADRSRSISVVQLHQEPLAVTDEGFVDVDEIPLHSRDSSPPNDDREEKSAYGAISEKPKRRIVPVLIAASSAKAQSLFDKTVNTTGAGTTEESLDHQSVDNDTQEAKGASPHWSSSRGIVGSNEGYLGRKSLPVNEIFYGNSQVGGPIVHGDQNFEDDQWGFCAAGFAPVGRRLYIHSLIRHYLRQSMGQEVQTANQELVVVKPYPTKFIPRSGIDSFTLFDDSGEKIVVRREDMMVWPFATQIGEDGPTKASRPGFSNTQRLKHLDRIQKAEAISAMAKRISNQDAKGNGSEAFRNDTYRDWDFLSKWQHVENDRIEPLYGHSGTEGEYDSDLWREIEEEKGIRSRKHRQRRPLPAVEVEAIIFDSIKALADKWKNQNAPKFERKAWSLWRRSRLGGRQDILIEEAKDHIERIDNGPLAKMKKEIAKEEWTSNLQLRQQCRIMEQTVFNREELLWKIALWGQPSQPERPLRKANKGIKSRLAGSRKIAPSEDDESPHENGSNLGEDEDDSGDESDDSLDGFVVSDEEDDENMETNSLGLMQATDQERQQADSSGFHVHDPHPEIMDLDDRAEASGKKGFAGELVSLREVSSNIPLAREVTSSTTEEVHNKLQVRSSVATSQVSPAQASQPSTLNQANSEPRVLTAPPLIGNSMLRPKQKPNLAKPQHTPPRSGDRKGLAQSRDNIIDLTLSDTEQGSSTLRARSPSMNLPNNFRMPNLEQPVPNRSVVTSSVKISSHESLRDFETESTGSDLGEHYLDFERINKIKYEILEESQDRVRLLIKLVYRLSDANRRWIMGLLSEKTREGLRSLILDALDSLSKNSKRMRGFDLESTKPYQTLSCIYLCFLSSIKLKPEKQGIRLRVIRNGMEDEAAFYAFRHLLQKILKEYEESGQFNAKLSNSEHTKRRSAPLETPQKKSADDLRTDVEYPHSKRKKPVKENTEALDARERDQNRVRLQRRREMNMQKRLKDLGVNYLDSPDQIPVNPGKLAIQAFIYINKDIGNYIKKHQVEGVQFLWREIVTDEESLRGCLLAHTMGLGKTMQVITLLLAITEASNDSDPKIHRQIPTSLKNPRILILCPPSLIENWWDEILMWTPESVREVFKPPRKVETQLPPMLRLREIAKWYENRGILLMSYEMFRIFVHNKAKKGSEKPLSDDQHRIVMEHLLEGPNIIVADEAHRLKNPKAAISIAAAGFKSRSRIALTGSPLANSLEEYYAMIDWIAPGYLGNEVEFRAHFVEPIKDGLYQDSSPAERRMSLKRLRVLEKSLAPKMNRAGINVLEGDLPPKTEFLIKVCLTDLQNEAYKLFVQSLLSNESDKIADARVWGWLRTLSLLCNHPKSFRDKLISRTGSKKTNRIDQTAEQDDDAVDEDYEQEPNTGDTSAQEQGIPLTCIEKELQLLANANPSINHIIHSYKMCLIDKILDASRAVAEKVLIFSQNIPTLDYLEQMLTNKGRRYCRLDGSTSMAARQAATKTFNSNEKSYEIYLISTLAGGIGLNLFGANRVILVDFSFNPQHEEQAVGRAYRMGQTKPVFVYRLIMGGTYEDVVHNKAVFKLQLASRVVDRKNPMRQAVKKARDYLFDPFEVEQKDLSEFKGKDPYVLDKILASEDPHLQRSIRSIELDETFHREIKEQLTAEEEKEADQEFKDEEIRRSDPAAYQRMIIERQRAELAAHAPADPRNALYSALPILGRRLGGLFPFPPSTAPVSSQGSAPAPFIGSLPTGSFIPRPNPHPFAQSFAPPPSSAPQPSTLITPTQPNPFSTTTQAPTSTPLPLSTQPPPGNSGNLLYPILGANTRMLEGDAAQSPDRGQTPALPNESS